MRFETTPQVEPRFGMDYIAEYSREVDWSQLRRCPDHGVYTGPQCPDCKWHEPKAA